MPACNNWEGGDAALTRKGMAQRMTARMAAKEGGGKGEREARDEEGKGGGGGGGVRKDGGWGGSPDCVVRRAWRR